MRGEKRALWDGGAVSPSCRSACLWTGSFHHHWPQLVTPPLSPFALRFGIHTTKAAPPSSPLSVELCLVPSNTAGTSWLDTGRAFRVLATVREEHAPWPANPSWGRGGGRGVETNHPTDPLISEQEVSAENETLGLFVTQQELTVTRP